MRHDDQQSIPRLILDRVIADAAKVWTPADFVDLGPREAVDKALQRMVRSDELRRIERGLYDRPKTNRLTKTQSVPDYRAIIEAVARRDKARFVIDGMTAANALGFTNAVPAKIEVLVDARLKSIELGNQRIVFKNAAPSRLYWAGRPGMYRPVRMNGTVWCHKALQKSYSELGFLSGRSSPAAMFSGRAKACLPRKLMCLSVSGDIRAISAGSMVQPSFSSWSSTRCM